MNDTEIGPLLTADGSGNVYVGGQISNSLTAVGPFPVNVPTGLLALCVASLDGAGNWRWATTALGRHLLYTADLTAGPSGHPTLTGLFSDTLRFGPTQLVSARRGAQRLINSYVARLDAATGQWQWAALVTGRGENYARAVAVDGLGRAVVAGFAHDTLRLGAITLPPAFANSFNLTPYVGQLSAGGQWLAAAAVTLLTPSANISSLVQVATNDAGDVLLTGTLPAYQARFGPHLLTGSRTTGYATQFAARLSGTPLQWQWVRALSDSLGTFQDSYRSLQPALDGAGNAYLAGRLSGAPSFSNLSVLPAYQDRGVAVAKLDPAGQTQWVALNTTPSLTAIGYASVKRLILTPAGQPIIGGDYSGPVQFGATTLTRYSYYNGYIAGLGVPLAVAPLLPADLPTADLWPNPARTATTLRLPMPAPGATAVQLLDGLGRVVSTVPVVAGATTVMLPLAGLAPGLYVVRGAGRTQRLVVGAGE